jgi:hypothetical protein
MTDTEPHVSSREIGRVPAVIVKIPSDFPVMFFAALMARAGYRLRWIRRGKA